MRMHSTELDIEISNIAEVTIVRPIGDLGVANVDAFAIALTPVAALHPQRVVLDLSKLTFISSLGMGKLVEFQRGLKQRDGIAVIASMQTDVKLAMQRARLDMVFSMYDTLDQALSAVSVT
jgi:anti-anti-sigma factor